MLDTAAKDGRRLIDWLDIAKLTAFCARCRAQGLTSGLAGSLETPDIPRLLLAGLVVAGCGGGGTTKISPASIGVYLENGGAAEIEKSFVEGGSATNEGSGYGSVAIAVGIGKEHEGCSLKVTESDVRGGSGSVSGGTGSVGIMAFYGTVSSIEKNVIE